jgi:hypothetical protein
MKINLLYLVLEAIGVGAAKNIGIEMCNCELIAVF